MVSSVCSQSKGKLVISINMRLYDQHSQVIKWHVTTLWNNYHKGICGGKRREGGRLYNGDT